MHQQSRRPFGNTPGGLADFEMQSLFPGRLRSRARKIFQKALGPLKNGDKVRHRASFDMLVSESPRKRGIKGVSFFARPYLFSAAAREKVSSKKPSRRKRRKKSPYNKASKDGESRVESSQISSDRPRRKGRNILSFEKGRLKKANGVKAPPDKDGAKSPAGRKKTRTEHPIRGEAKF